MLADLLERFEFVAVTNETAFVSRLLSLTTLPVADRLTEYLFEEPQFNDLGLSKVTVLTMAQRHTDVKSLSEAIIAEHLRLRYPWFEDSTERCIIVKHPPTNHLRQFEHLWPDAKAILMVRDGRDVHLSKANSTNLAGRSFSQNVLQSALNWQYKSRVFLSTLWIKHIVRYEDILENPERVAEIVSWLGVKTQVSERPDKKFVVPESHRHFHGNVGAGVIRRNKGKFDPDGYVNFIYSLVCIKELESFGYGGLSRRSACLNPMNLLHLLFDSLRFIFGSLANTARMILFDTHRLRMRLHKLKSRLG